MKPFSHFNARTLDEAVSLLQRYGDKAHVIAGGTDLIGKMKDRILPGYPEALVNIKTVPGMSVVEESNGTTRIGALAKLDEIAENGMINERYPALAQAAGRTASPHLRAMGTLSLIHISEPTRPY